MYNNYPGGKESLTGPCPTAKILTYIYPMAG